MVDCSKCGKKLGFLSTKNKIDDESVLCNSCFNEWKKNKKDKDKNVMIDYIKKYLSNKDMEMDGYILGCHKNKDINALFEEDSLQKVTEHFETVLSNAEYSNKSGMSSYDVDEIINTKKMCEEVLKFLNDLEKMYKLFDKKGINTDYFEILSLFAEVIEGNLNKEYDKILIPAYKRISKRLGKNISSEKVVKEFMKIPLNIDYNFDLISKLLDKFGLNYNKEEVEELIEETQEEMGLDEFEEDLGSTQNIKIGDFEKLNGYEFEGYLKGLFNLLGYTVIETSLSGDQGADLIISKNGQKTVVQAKKYSDKVPNKAIQEISAARRHYKADNAIVVTNSSFTKSAIDLALSNDVELWDGQKLKDVIKGVKCNKEEKSLRSEKSLSLKRGDKVKDTKVLCPFCEEEFVLDKDIMQKDSDLEIECPNCGSCLKMNIQHSWHCNECGKVFKTEEEAKKHEKICKKGKK